jgi:hypothetical protein
MSELKLRPLRIKNGVDRRKTRPPEAGKTRTLENHKDAAPRILPTFNVSATRQAPPLQ